MATASADANQLSDGRPAGAVLGLNAADVVGLHGSTSAQAALVTAVSTSALVLVSGAYGFATEAQATALVSAVNNMLTALKNHGVIASS